MQREDGEIESIGIDIGNNNTCISIWYENYSSSIKNDFNQNLTPNYFSNNPSQNEKLIGFQGKNACLRNMKNTFYDLMILLNKSKDQRIKSTFDWPFKIEENLLQTNEKGTNKLLVDLFKKIKEIIEKKFKKFNVVLSISSVYDKSQKDLLINSGKEAELNIIGTISNSLSSCLGYTFANISANTQKLLIFDLGASKLEIAVIEVEEGGKYKILAEGGNDSLGGRYFDREFFKFAKWKFEKEQNIKIDDNQLVKRQLEIECEKAKISLSESKSTFISFYYKIDGEENKTNISITRNNFENRLEKLFEQCIQEMDKVIKRSGINKDEIDEIIMVGGSSRIPKIKEKIGKYFDEENGEKKINCSLNPDEAVSYGAAIYCAKLMEVDDKRLNEFIPPKESVEDLRKGNLVKEDSRKINNQENEWYKRNELKEQPKENKKKINPSLDSIEENNNDNGKESKKSCSNCCCIF